MEEVSFRSNKGSFKYGEEDRPVCSKLSKFTCLAGLLTRRAIVDEAIDQQMLGRSSFSNCRKIVCIGRNYA